MFEALEYTWKYDLTAIIQYDQLYYLIIMHSRSHIVKPSKSSTLISPVEVNKKSGRRPGRINLTNNEIIETPESNITFQQNF